MDLVSTKLFSKYMAAISLKKDALELVKKAADENDLVTATELHAEAIKMDAITVYRNLPQNVRGLTAAALAFDSRGYANTSALCYLKAIKLAPQMVPAHLRVAQHSLAVGEVEYAVYHYLKVREIEPQNAKAYWGIGSTGLLPES